MGEEVYGHKVAVDLINGVIIIDYEDITLQNGTIEIHNPKLVMYICDETNRLFDIFHVDSTEPDAEGNYYNTFRPLEWRPIAFETNPLRPISFIRHTNLDQTYVIGAQTTLPENFGGKNVKKMVSIFSDGSLGID